MGCMTKNPAVRRFYSRTIATNAVYIVLTLCIALYFYKFHPQGPLATVLALLPAVALLGFIIAIALYLIEDKDEFQRNQMVDVLLWGLGGVLVFTSAWGSLETFTHIRHFNPSLTYQIFWLCAAIRTPFLLRKYR